MSNFIGRNKELAKLLEYKKKKSSSFILVRGRRRIGKSRLIYEFAKNFKQVVVFSGLPPDVHTIDILTPANAMGF